MTDLKLIRSGNKHAKGTKGGIHVSVFVRGGLTLTDADDEDT